MNNNKHTIEEVRMQVNIDDLKCGDWIFETEGKFMKGKVVRRGRIVDIYGGTVGWTIWSESHDRQYKADFNDSQQTTFTILRNETNATQGECL